MDIEELKNYYDSLSQQKYWLSGRDSEINQCLSLFNGTGKVAQESYIQSIFDVLKNCQKYLCQDYDVFLVASDKFNLYPKIAELSGMKIVNQFKRPVLNRAEKTGVLLILKRFFILKINS